MHHTVPPIYFTRRARDQAKIGDFTIKDQRTISDARAFKSCSLGQCAPACAIFMSIVTILVSFEAILQRFSVRINFKSQFQSNNLPQALKYIKIASKFTSIVTRLANIALAGVQILNFSSIGSILVSITTILTNIVTILASIEQVNTP